MELAPFAHRRRSATMPTPLINGIHPPKYRIGTTRRCGCRSGPAASLPAGGAETRIPRLVSAASAPLSSIVPRLAAAAADSRALDPAAGGGISRGWSSILLLDFPLPTKSGAERRGVGSCDSPSQERHCWYSVTRIRVPASPSAVPVAGSSADHVPSGSEGGDLASADARARRRAASQFPGQAGRRPRRRSPGCVERRGCHPLDAGLRSRTDRRLSFPAGGARSAYSSQNRQVAAAGAERRANSSSGRRRRLALARQPQCGPWFRHGYRAAMADYFDWPSAPDVERGRRLRAGA